MIRVVRANDGAVGDDDQRLNASSLLSCLLYFCSKASPHPPRLRRANDLSSLVYFYSKTSLYETVEIAIRISVIKILAHLGINTSGQVLNTPIEKVSRDGSSEHRTARNQQVQKT